MKGIEFDPVLGRIAIVNGDRVVTTSDGTLMLLLPELHQFDDVEITYPDGTGGWIYGWRGKQDYSLLAEEYGQLNSAKVWFTRLPEEWEDPVTLMAAPAGADIFVGHVRLTRTVAPTHSWLGQVIDPVQKTGEWIGWQGSGLIEAGFGLTRLMHLVIEGDNLVLVPQQSIGAYCGGTSREWGDGEDPFSGTMSDNEGGTFHNSGSPGVVVWSSNASPYLKTSTRTVSSGSNYFTHRLAAEGGSDPCSTTDPTNYSSTYSVDVRGYFGRRS